MQMQQDDIQDTIQSTYHRVVHQMDEIKQHTHKFIQVDVIPPHHQERTNLDCLKDIVAVPSILT
jgi:hypothetical protein